MTTAELSQRLVALEEAALARWLDGDPSGFLELCDDDVVYFDPFVPQRLDGLERLRAHYEPLRGTIHADRFELLSPKVQQVGDAAVLTFNFVSCAAAEAPLRWNCTEVFRKRADSRIGNDDWKLIQTHWSFTGPRQT